MVVFTSFSTSVIHMIFFLYIAGTPSVGHVKGSRFEAVHSTGKAEPSASQLECQLSHFGLW